MMKRRWFGTDGIRGKFGEEPMTPGFAERCGRALVKIFGEGEFVISRDTRGSGVVLEEALQWGIEESGGEARVIGVLPTAAVSIVTKEIGAQAGVMISASHNPAEDNGLKFFDAEGFKLADEVENALEQAIASMPEEAVNAGGAALDFSADPGAKESYRAMLKQSVPEDFSLKGVKIVADLANGAAWRTTPEILRMWGAEVEVLYAQPDGQNINLNCGSTAPAELQKRIRQLNDGWIGLAHDGDADRVVLVDENGELLDGDEMMAIVALDWLRRGVLKSKTLVTTTMSNMGLDEVIKKQGGRVLRTDVGDRYVLDALRKEKLNMGGESSGHMIFLDYAPSGDGLLTALQVFAVMMKEQEPLKELRKTLRRYPHELTNVAVKEKIPLSDLPELTTAVQEAEKRLAGEGRILLRYSGTEKKLRLLIEAKDAGMIRDLKPGLLEAVQESFNTISKK